MWWLLAQAWAQVPEEVVVEAAGLLTNGHLVGGGTTTLTILGLASFAHWKGWITLGREKAAPASAPVKEASTPAPAAVVPPADLAQQVAELMASQLAERERVAEEENHRQTVAMLQETLARFQETVAQLVTHQEEDRAQRQKNQVLLQQLADGQSHGLGPGFRTELQDFTQSLNALVQYLMTREAS